MTIKQYQYTPGNPNNMNCLFRSAIILTKIYKLIYPHMPQRESPEDKILQHIFLKNLLCVFNFG